jgi:hypothetical protein
MIDLKVQMVVRTACGEVTTWGSLMAWRMAKAKAVRILASVELQRTWAEKMSCEDMMGVVVLILGGDVERMRLQSLIIRRMAGHWPRMWAYDSGLWKQSLQDGEETTLKLD